MALPQINTVPYYDIVIPSTGEMSRYRPYLVKEEKVDILIEKVQLLHTCIDSLKNYINTHITTTSNQYAIINDQLQSIRSQNKINAKSTQDQFESMMVNTALEIN